MEAITYKNLSELLEHRVFYHFGEICKIPHQSFKEKELSDFILNWAKDLGLEVEQDEKFNLLIKKPGTMGQKGAKPVILQAHIDMVCEKSKDSNHDFDNDPIVLQLDGDVLSTGERTTLGADNGIGVAYGMAILEDKSISHPDLVVIFTTAEEEDMSGALSVDKSWLSTNQIINLDNAIEKEIVVGSAGGKGVELKLPISSRKIPDGWNTYKIDIGGLTGGHSGEDINKGLAHANNLLGRLLNALGNEFEFLINDIKGGNFRLAIPRDSHVVLSTNPSNYTKLQEILEELTRDWKTVYQETDDGLFMNLEVIERVDSVLDKDSSDKLVNAMMLSPSGINDMLGSLGVVESSCNPGEIYIEDEHFYIITEIRATFETNREFIYEKILLISNLLGGSVREFAKYPSWMYKANSKLRDLAKDTYMEMYGEEVKILAAHAGLECGCFSDKVDDMDAISIGPDTWNLHSPTESVGVKSTIRVYDYLVEILKKLA